MLLGFSILALIQHQFLTIECVHQYLEGAEGEREEIVSFRFQDVCLGGKFHGLYALELETVCAIPEYLENKLQKPEGICQQDPTNVKPQQHQTALTGRAKISELFNTEDTL